MIRVWKANSYIVNAYYTISVHVKIMHFGDNVLSYAYIVYVTLS